MWWKIEWNWYSTNGKKIMENSIMLYYFIECIICDSIMPLKKLKAAQALLDPNRCALFAWSGTLGSYFPAYINA